MSTQLHIITRTYICKCGHCNHTWKYDEATHPRTHVSGVVTATSNTALGVRYAAICPNCRQAVRTYEGG